MITIPAKSIQFEVGGKTIYINSRHGMPMFKIICSGSISIKEIGSFQTECEIRVTGDIQVSVTHSDARANEQ